MNRLSYKRIGVGYPLVLIHGYLGGQSMWKFQEELMNYYDLIMPSLAGYGESSHLISPSTIIENANQVFDLLNYLGIEKFNLLGHSMGGMVVQEMTALYPGRINKLICFGTGSIGVLPNRFETIEESRASIKSLGLEQVRRKIAKTWFVDYLEGEGYKLCLEEGKKATTQAALASLDAWEGWDGKAKLKHIKCPTLIIWSTKDRSYDWAQQEILRNGIADSRIKIIENCAHNSHMEEPLLFNKLIKDFLL